MALILSDLLRLQCGWQDYIKTFSLCHLFQASNDCVTAMGGPYNCRKKTDQKQSTLKSTLLTAFCPQYNAMQRDLGAEHRGINTAINTVLTSQTGLSSTPPAPTSPSPPNAPPIKTRRTPWGSHRKSEKLQLCTMQSTWTLKETKNGRTHA